MNGHDDEYDALARQFHESIADGQTVAETAKALRLQAAAPVDGGLRAALRGVMEAGHIDASPAGGRCQCHAHTTARAALAATPHEPER